MSPYVHRPRKTRKSGSLRTRSRISPPGPLHTQLPLATNDAFCESEEPYRWMGRGPILSKTVSSDISELEVDSEEWAIEIFGVSPGCDGEEGSNAFVVEEGWGHSLYHDIVEQSALDSYLSTTISGYEVDDDGNGRWAALPQAPSNHTELCGPLCDVISRIVTQLGAPGGNGNTREVVNSHSPIFKFGTLKNNCPDLSIKATGPAFEKPRLSEEYVDGLGFSNVASVFQVFIDGNKPKDAEQAATIESHCRDIFTQQPTRNFVRSLILTEQSARLVHCDRSGVYLTPFIDIHQSPHTFMRLVLGLSSMDEGVLGFDTTVKLKVDPSNGRKTGTITTVGDDGIPVPYILRMDQPPYTRSELVGRGTTCWLATHPVTGERVVIKDAWRPESRLPEGDFLNAAKGIDGVVQVLSHQDCLAETKGYRPDVFEWKNSENRIKSRVVMKQYGLPIDCFTSRFQAIAALRDAIAGNRELLSRGVVHKDISIQNILFGPPGAPPGRRGVLIDLDMAGWVRNSRRELRVNPFLGTRRFQSISVLLSEIWHCFPSHDYFDDLESIFYVLCTLVLLFEKPGVRSEPDERNFVKWDHSDPVCSGEAKVAFVNAYPIEASPFWGEVCEELIIGVKAILKPILDRKDAIRVSRKVPKEAKPDKLEAIGKEFDSDDVYKKVIKLFDDALLAIEREDREAAGVVASTSTLPTASATSSPQVPPVPKADGRSFLKRPAGGNHSEASLAKRLHRSSTLSTYHVLSKA
ncbi:hypothetical protein D9611_002968 [Ephemerocybe angulata]|uniref:Protein kinase domain-containing protein n=1 Tax=Ephemerocybe angulata TaxID=980116 RepID=A0A8H5C8D1_9AGAR|nr:hypothetical protein D9611_002968 [Tulosesus angulatus]